MGLPFIGTTHACSTVILSWRRSTCRRWRASTSPRRSWHHAGKSNASRYRSGTASTARATSRTDATGRSGEWTCPAPFTVVTFAVGIVVSVPYTATNQAHTLTVRLLHADGEAVSPYAPGVERARAVEAHLPFNLGRPPGDFQHLPLGLNFGNLPLPSLGGYSVAVLIDGTEMRRLPFRVMANSPVVQMPGPVAG